jgi:hypothetical protein
MFEVYLKDSERREKKNQAWLIFFFRAASYLRRNDRVVKGERRKIKLG